MHGPDRGDVVERDGEAGYAVAGIVKNAAAPEAVEQTKRSHFKPSEQMR